MTTFKTNSMRLLFTLFLIPFLFAACNGVEEPEFLGVKETKLESLSFSKGVMKVVLEYKNPNKFGIDIKETNLDVSVKGKFLGVAEQTEMTHVAKNSTFEFPLFVHFDPIKAAGIAFNNASKSSIPLEIQGTAKVGKKGVFIKVPIHVTEEVDIR